MSPRRPTIEDLDDIGGSEASAAERAAPSPEEEDEE